ncbi:MAG TPA: dephospho-CoA kinase [Pyrinomonadaceae bacterium]|nr:dephospho-CoA kinase [Pyrinomonadaceae bacterium]
MLKVGLTGSIAVGKSFVLECFRELGCQVLDADKTARDVVAKGSDGLAEIVKKFGSDVLSADGSLDRKAMAAIVFADTEKRELLNSIVHPRVFTAQNEWLLNIERDDPNAIAIVDAALMIESGGYRRFDKLIVVWCESAIQLKRLMLRDSLDQETAEQRIAAQLSQDEKKSFADFLINTSAGFDDTKRQVKEVYDDLVSLICSDETDKAPTPKAVP